MRAEGMELVMALRCSARPRTEEDSCVDCPYRGLDECSNYPDIPVKPDFIDVETGIGYWEYCDTEQMALDAAEQIEKLLGGDK